MKTNFKSKEEVSKAGGRVIFFNKTLTNYQHWHKVHFIIGLISLIIGAIILSQAPIEFVFTLPFVGFFGIFGAALSLLFSDLFVPFYFESLRCGWFIFYNQLMIL